MSPVIELLQRLVSFPALSGEESEIADFVVGWAEQRGLSVDRFENNVFCWIGSGDQCLLLNSHLDVVPASNDHPFDPFDPIIVDGRLFGRGSVDAKASGAAMLSALATLSDLGWEPDNGKLIVALTACEETSRPKNGLQSLLPILPPLHGAVVGEPTNLRPCFSQKGLLILTLTAHGKSAHAARPDQGENAIVKAARDIAAIDDFSFSRIHPLLGGITKVVTTIDGGSANNVVPETCSFVVDLRTTPSYTHAELIEAVKAIVQSDVAVSSERYVPTETPEPSRIAAAVRAAVPDATPFGSPTVSDWAFLGSVPAVKLGPGDSRLSHTGQESVSIEEVTEASRVYQTIASRFFESAGAETKQTQAHAVEERL